MCSPGSRIGYWTHENHFLLFLYPINGLYFLILSTCKHPLCNTFNIYIIVKLMATQAKHSKTQQNESSRYSVSRRGPCRSNRYNHADLVQFWPSKGTRPWVAQQQQVKAAYLFGAVCPQRDEGLAIVVSTAKTESRQYHLQAPSEVIPEDRHSFFAITSLYALFSPARSAYVRLYCESSATSSFKQRRSEASL